MAAPLGAVEGGADLGVLALRALGHQTRDRQPGHERHKSGDGDPPFRRRRAAPACGQVLAQRRLAVGRCLGRCLGRRRAPVAQVGTRQVGGVGLGVGGGHGGTAPGTVDPQDRRARRRSPVSPSDAGRGRGRPKSWAPSATRGALTVRDGCSHAALPPLPVRSLRWLRRHSVVSGREAVPLTGEGDTLKGRRSQPDAR